MNSSVTMKTKHLIGLVAVAVLAIVAYVIAGPSPVKPVEAAGGAPANTCVAPSAVSEVPSGLGSVPVVADEPEVTVPEVTPEHNHGGHSHDTEGDINVLNGNDILSHIKVSDVVDVGDVGDVNVLTDVVDVNGNTVNVTDTLNPITSLLSTVKVL